MGWARSTGLGIHGWGGTWREAPVVRGRRLAGDGRPLPELNPVDVRALALGANALNLDGQQARALRWSEKAIGLKPDDQSVLINAACVRAQAGLKEEALRLLEDCFSRGWGKRDWIEHDPDYHSLRDDPRFQALLARLR